MIIYPNHWPQYNPKQGWYQFTPHSEKYGKEEKIPCAHKSCSECHGTGRKKNGGMCVHMISCRCASCNPSYF